MLGGRLMPWGCETGIPTSATPATGDNTTVLGLGKIVKLFAGGLIVDDRAHWDRQDDVVPIAAFPVAAFTVAASFRRVLRVIAEVEQRIVMVARLENDVASTASVSAGRSAFGHKFLPTKCQAAIAAVPGLDSDANFVDKHASPVRGRLKGRAPKQTEKGPPDLCRRPIEMQAD